MRREVNFACRTCGNGLVLPLEAAASLACTRCSATSQVAVTEPGQPLGSCAACGSEALFVQRDFNRLLGLAIVAVAALFAVQTRFLSLVAAALVDLVLYRALPRITVCYACDAIHRGVPVNPRHTAYDHHVEDMHKVEKSKRQVATQHWRRSHGV